MLFLLNAVVLKLPETVHLPRELAHLKRASPKAVLEAGEVLYAKHPRLEYDRRDIAEWYCALLVSKAPEANGALFVKGSSGYVGQVAVIPFPLLASLRTDQERGRSIEGEVYRTVWAAASMVTYAPG
ncbi:MAG: hypothetical protein GC203_19350 [Phenylobacterium sp.]|uniref:hypothetical protein n=1 Tax=Phenylobacterium sp. TaxID=1871053 RepID=UPI00260026CA|nr:hypothetical protein [Phenylobacterium sp.]MBI1200020.1 hypothetical protein [Phenylobacterium sp.]